MEMAYSLGWNDVRQKPSGKWEARWADESGKARGKCFLTKDQARKYASDRANGLLNVAVGLTVNQKDIREALAEFLARSLNAKTTALNERRMTTFLAFASSVKFCNEITEAVINSFDNALRASGANPGGRQHVLKIVRAFCKFAMRKKWMVTSPFFPFGDFKLPKSTYQGRALTPKEFADLISIESRYPVDVHLNRAFRLGRATMLRISQVWKLTPEDFRAPDQLYVDGIKGQPPEWKPLHPDALEVLNELLPLTQPGQRFFSHWGTVEAMRNSVEDKARRAKLAGVRFHDAGKVTRVSELADAGWSPAKIAHVSNTTAKTLVAHYIKADRNQSFAEYKSFQRTDLPQTYRGPEMALNTTKHGSLGPIELNKSKGENSSTSQPIPAV